MTAEDGIRAGGEALAGAINAKDAAAAAALYTADGAVLPPGAPRQHGTEAIRDFWQAAIDAGLAEVTLATDEVREAGDQAVEVGTLRGMMGGTPLVGKYLVHWTEQGGVWKLHRDIWNLDG
jgi:uncharacterized protein (TIGR02246 family)